MGVVFQTFPEKIFFFQIPDFCRKIGKVQSFPDFFRVLGTLFLITMTSISMLDQVYLNNRQSLKIAS